MPDANSAPDESQETSALVRNRILWNNRDRWPYERGEIDEIVMSNVDIHIEQMNEGCWWIGIYSRDNDEHYWMGNIHIKNPRSRAHITFTEQENAGIVWDRDDTHER